MKKFLGLFMVTLLLFGGCGTTTNTDEVAQEITSPVTLELWHPFAGEVEATLQQITDEFNLQNDMVDVNLVGQGVYNDLYTKLTAAKESNTLPTMSFAYSSWDVIFDSVVDLSTYTDLPNTTINFPDFVQPFLDEVTAKDGAIYGLPYNKSSEVLFYNKDLIKQAGIDTVPTSLEELFDMAKIITDKTGVVGVGFDSLSNFLATSMISNDVPWIDSEGNFDFTNPKVEEQVTMYQKAIEDGYARTRGEDSYFTDIFGAANVATYVGSSAGVSYIKSAVNDKFDWGAIALPTEKVVQQGTNIVIFSSATPEEKLGAWEYLNYLFQDENLVDFALATGYIPPTMTALNSTEYQKAMQTDEVIQATYEEIDKMQVGLDRFIGASEIFNNNMATAMSKILETYDDVDQTLQTLNEEAQAIYDRNN